MLICSSFLSIESGVLSKSTLTGIWCIAENSSACRCIPSWSRDHRLPWNEDLEPGGPIRQSLKMRFHAAAAPDVLRPPVSGHRSESEAQPAEKSSVGLRGRVVREQDAGVPLPVPAARAPVEASAAVLVVRWPDARSAR